MSASSSVVSLIVAGVALVVAIHALKHSNLNSSAATLIAMNTGFQQGWARYLDPNSNSEHEFAELTNLFEIACAIHCEGSIHGVSRKILEGYLCDTLKLVAAHPEACKMLYDAQESAETYEFIQQFLRNMKRKGKAEPFIGLIHHP